MLEKLIFKPLSLIVGWFVARKVADRAFDNVWARRYGTEAPVATTRQATWPQVLGAAALRGSIFAVSAAVCDRATAKSVAYVTGFWPGEEEPPPAKRIEAKRQ
jgi:hypothetical protein